VVAYRVKNILVYIFVTFFIIFLCVTLKLFSLSFVPLLVPNSCDATAHQLYFKGPTSKGRGKEREGEVWERGEKGIRGKGREKQCTPTYSVLL